MQERLCCHVQYTVSQVEAGIVPVLLTRGQTGLTVAAAAAAAERCRCLGRVSKVFNKTAAECRGGSYTHTRTEESTYTLTHIRSDVLIPCEGGAPPLRAARIE